MVQRGNHFFGFCPGLDWNIFDDNLLKKGDDL